MIWSTDELKMPRFICIFNDLYTYHRYFSPYLLLKNKKAGGTSKNIFTSLLLSYGYFCFLQLLVFYVSGNDIALIAICKSRLNLNWGNL